MTQHALAHSPLIVGALEVDGLVAVASAEFVHSAERRPRIIPDFPGYRPGQEIEGMPAEVPAPVVTPPAELPPPASPEEVKRLRQLRDWLVSHFDSRGRFSIELHEEPDLRRLIARTHG